MLFNFNELIKKHNLNIKGVVHVGAHDCGEILNYTENGFAKAILVEANPIRAKRLKTSVEAGRYPTCTAPLQYANLTPEQAALSKNYEVHNYICCDKDGEVMTLNTATVDGGVDSIYLINDFGISSSWTNYQHVGKVDVPTITLDTLVKDTDFNFLNIDVEGAEHLVLGGATRLLSTQVEYVMVETQEKSRFDGSCLHKDIVDLLAKFGFKQVDYYDTGKLWGDVLFVRQ
jgi:FkbM family methyltransferase